ncbi:site-specific integrase [Alistipes ihumii]|uniref:site-specific integrase n=1 Tax=Alistipes ihumii TaxID=1470347 RepID=UPI003FEDFD02
MARSTFKVLFYLKRQAEQNGKAPIMGRITINGTISQFSCKLSVSPKLWDTKANKASGKSVVAQRINEKLENIKTNIGKQYQRICDRDSYVTAEKVKNAWLGFGDGYQLLLQTFDDYLKEFSEKRVGKDRAASTLENYTRARRYLAAFLQYEYKVEDIPFRELKRDFIEKYAVYLSTVRGMLPGSIITPVKKLKLMSYTAFKNGWIASDPFAGFRVAGKYRDRRFLSESELQAVMDVQVPNYKTAIVRDIFVFCCFTGLSYADVKKLSHDDIHTDERGDMWIIDHRQKTGTQFRVKLLPVAKELVERYSRLKLPESKVFPVKDRDSMNMSLRHVARHAGLSFSPTMHEARHTFSTTVTLSQGVPLETVSKMLGHKHITTTQIYAKITNDKIGRDMDMLSEKLAEKFKIA